MCHGNMSPHRLRPSSHGHNDTRKRRGTRRQTDMVTGPWMHKKKKQGKEINQIIKHQNNNWPLNYKCMYFVRPLTVDRSRKGSSAIGKKREMWERTPSLSVKWIHTHNDPFEGCQDFFFVLSGQLAYRVECSHLAKSAPDFHQSPRVGS